MRLKAKWAIDPEAMRARGIIVLVKSNLLVKHLLPTWRVLADVTLYF